MNKKSVSATILVLFLSLIFAVIGATFSTYVYSKNKIEVESVRLVSASFDIYSDRELSNKITKLELSSQELGLKPATGELDQETEIPSTITNEGTSEGYYATIFVGDVDDFSITIKNINIVTNRNQVEANEERENIFVAIKDVNDSVKNLKEDETLLANFRNVESPLEITFFIWLGALSGEELVGSQISFDLVFELIA